MIVDCHTHIWQTDAQLGQYYTESRTPAAGKPGRPNRALVAEPTLTNHMAASSPVDKSIVLAFKSKYLKAEIPNQLIAEYVRQHPEKLVGFAGVDPTFPAEAVDEMRHAHGQLGLKGITISPAGQDFHPADSRAMQVFAEAARLKMPVLIHQGTHFTAASKMEYARPVLLDEVAREIPAVKLIVAHMGYPWIDECIVLLGKHPNVFADISGLLHRPWQAFNALLAAYQYGVMDKLFFGSDFPYTSATACIEALYSINQIALGTHLPTVPRQHLRGIVERDALAVLGIASPEQRKLTTGLFFDDEA